VPGTCIHCCGISILMSLAHEQHNLHLMSFRWKHPHLLPSIRCRCLDVCDGDNNKSSGLIVHLLSRPLLLVVLLLLLVEQDALHDWLLLKSSAGPEQQCPACDRGHRLRHGCQQVVTTTRPPEAVLLHALGGFAQIRRSKQLQMLATTAMSMHMSQHELLELS
jgi:hypothetical protein